MDKLMMYFIIITIINLSLSWTDLVTGVNKTTDNKVFKSVCDRFVRIFKSVFNRFDVMQKVALTCTVYDRGKCIYDNIKVF